MSGPLSPYELDQLADAIASRVLKRLNDSFAPDAFLNRAEAAEALGVSIATLERLTARGVIPSRKFGRSRRYVRAELLAIAEDNQRSKGKRQDATKAPQVTSPSEADGWLGSDTKRQTPRG